VLTKVVRIIGQRSSIEIGFEMVGRLIVNLRVADRNRIARVGLRADLQAGFRIDSRAGLQADLQAGLRAVLSVGLRSRSVLRGLGSVIVVEPL
jgi:hypothetical protein